MLCVRAIVSKELLFLFLFTETLFTLSYGDPRHVIREDGIIFKVVGDGNQQQVRDEEGAGQDGEEPRGED